MKIAAFSVSSDFWTKVDKWLEQSCALGSLNYADIFTFHPYGSREVTSKEPADKNIAWLKSVLAKHKHGNMPMWNSELYYLFDRKSATDQSECTPDELIRRTLTDHGEGLGQSIAIHGNSLWKCLLTPNQLGGERYQTVTLNENGAAINAYA